MPIEGNDRVGEVFSAFVAEALLHFIHDLGFFLWVSDPGEEIGPTPIEGALWNELADASAGGCVSVLVLGNVEAFGASVFDVGEHFVGLTPGSWPGEFDMRDFCANMRLASDAEDFVK